MKSVLISIQPKWCELIANGKKTVEVRKTRPKLDVPFKVYIYQTKKPVAVSFNGTGKHISEYDKTYYYNKRSGKVMGEFVCAEIEEVYQCNSGWIKENACISQNDFFDYLGIPRGTHLGYDKKAYAWHISDLEIYDTPKELGEYIVPSKIGCCNEGKCRGCKWFDRGNGFDLEDDCNAKFDTDEYKPLRRPPQSWCYVEDLNDR